MVSDQKALQCYVEKEPSAVFVLLLQTTGTCNVAANLAHEKIIDNAVIRNHLIQ